MYLLSSMAERLEWSQEEDEAEGRRRNKQLVSCCCRSMNCFMKLSLERTTTQRHDKTAERVSPADQSNESGFAARSVHPNVITFAARFSFCAWRQTLSLQKDTVITASVTAPQQTDRWAAKEDIWGSEEPSCPLISYLMMKLIIRPAVLTAVLFQRKKICSLGNRQQKLLSDISEFVRNLLLWLVQKRPCPNTFSARIYFHY